MAQNDNKTKREAIKNANIVPVDAWASTNFYPTLEQYSDEGYEKAIERMQIRRHRNIWSYALLILVFIINIFSLYVVYAIGRGWLDYPTEIAVPAVIGANFAETFALTKIAMKFYFKNDDNDKA